MLVGLEKSHLDLFLAFGRAILNHAENHGRGGCQY